MGRGLVMITALSLVACAGKRTVPAEDGAGERGRQVPDSSASATEVEAEVNEAKPRSRARLVVGPTFVARSPGPGSADGSTGPTFPASPIDNGSLATPARGEPGWSRPVMASVSDTDTETTTDSESGTGAEAEPESEPAPESGTAMAAAADPLSTALRDPAAAKSRRQQFAVAVEAISTQLGMPISAKRALADMPCGGWSGPDCSNLTIGIEIAKLGAPTIARFHRKRTADITQLLIEAVSIHSVWHDAFGYVYRKHKLGPGYTYAGCLFSRCDAAGFKNGQVDGILYQVGRLLGVVSGPACGPRCKLP